jgi:hypothetical protein
MLLLKVALVRKWRRPDRFNKAVKVTISRRYQIDAGIIWLHIQGQSAPLRREGFCPVLAKRITALSTKDSFSLGAMALREVLTRGR